MSNQYIIKYYKMIQNHIISKFQVTFVYGKIRISTKIDCLYFYCIWSLPESQLHRWELWLNLMRQHRFVYHCQIIGNQLAVKLIDLRALILRLQRLSKFLLHIRERGLHIWSQMIMRVELLWIFRESLVSMIPCRRTARKTSDILFELNESRNISILCKL